MTIHPFYNTVNVSFFPAPGEEFVKDEQLDLYSIVKDEVKPNTPVLLSCVTGYDASGMS